LTGLGERAEAGFVRRAIARRHEQFVDLAAHRLLGRVAEVPFGRRVPVRDRALAVDDHDRIRHRRGADALLDRDRDRDRSLDRRRQAQQVAFEHVILGAGLQQFDGAFVTHRAGDHDDRHLGVDMPDMRQCLSAAEIRQRVVGQQHIGCEGFQRRDEIGPGGDPLGGEIEPGLPQCARHQLGVGRYVLQNEDLQRRRARPL
jgi:hypothetical protein